MRGKGFKVGPNSVVKRKAVYIVAAGEYEAPTLWRLCWEVFKHRCCHLLKNGRWTD